MKNKLVICYIIVLISVSFLFGEDSHRVWIYFKDKGQIESKDVTVLSKQHLSEKSINRRAGKSTPIKYDFTDLPLYKNYLVDLSNKGISLIHKSKWFNAVSAYVNDSQYKELIGVKYIKKIESVKSFKYKSNENNQDIQAYKKTDFDYGSSFNQNNMIGVPAFHSRNYNASGIIIAIFDTGFRLNHDALQSVNVLDSWDFVENDNDVSGTYGYEHGTKVLGVIGGYSPGNLIGPAYGADYLLAKTEDELRETHLEEDNWVAAAEWADSLGADIISTSVGYNIFETGEGDYTYEDMDGNTTIITKGADLAVKKGIAVFASAGNEGNNSWYHIIAPADGDSVIAIGNVTSIGALSPSSSRGPTWDGRIKPDLVAQGTSVHTVATYNNTGFTQVSGTSYSTPLAAGAGALVLSYDSTLTPRQLYNTLITHASNANNPNNDIGYGIINISSIIGGTISDPKNPIKISPNPFSDYVNINLDYASEKNLIIYNSLGQKIKTFKNNKTSFIWYGDSDADHRVSSGVYFIVLRTKNSHFIKKIVFIK
jgi:serine protease AprX